MWMMTSTGGFFSAVQHRDNHNLLMVRCRAEEDAKYIAAKLGTDVIKSSGLADYEYRVICSKAEYCSFVVNEVLAIDYDNFKNSVKDRQGSSRANVYMRVWSALLSLQPVAPYAAVPPAKGGYVWAGAGPRGGRQMTWWDESDILHGPTGEELDALEGVTDDPEFWNCRDCNRDITDCRCFNDSPRQARETSAARQKTRKRNSKKGRRRK